MGRRKPSTPRSRVTHALRQLWLRSRERAAAIKATGHTCIDCGAKQSVAKGREVKIEVHHEPQIDWSGIVDLIFDRILNAPQVPVCKDCHKKRHEKSIAQKTPECI
jgi:predicted HNH restriction endonuclease